MYDFDIYTKEKKQTNAEDFLNLAPGPRCGDHSRLESELRKLLVERRDEYTGERLRVKNFIYDYHDGKSGERIIEYLLKKVIRTYLKNTFLAILLILQMSYF